MKNKIFMMEQDEKKKSVGSGEGRWYKIIDNEWKIPMMVRLTVVGVRNYCKHKEADLPALFERYPLGSKLYLYVVPEGMRFAGAVKVKDEMNQRIGFVSKTERHLILLAIPKNGMLGCVVVGHSLEDKSMTVEVENRVGVKEPLIRNAKAAEEKMKLMTTEHDENLIEQTLLLLGLMKVENPDLETIKKSAMEYAEICCTSLDGETTFSREEILHRLKGLDQGNGMFTDVIKDIFEQKKDLGKRGEEMMTRVYQEQYKRIKKSAYMKGDGGKSKLENYIEKLKFLNGKKLTSEVIEKEILRLSELQAGELEGTYVENIESDKGFAKALYSLNYSLRATYVLYTRRIMIEYLEKLKEENRPADFINKGLSDEEILRADKELRSVVGTYGMQDIVNKLYKMSDEGKVDLLANATDMYNELLRIGMPKEGNSYSTFSGYYTPEKKVKRKKSQANKASKEVTDAQTDTK